MVYTQKEKKKIDNLLEVFADYTAKHSGFDIAYSDKSGYVRLITADCADTVFFYLEDFDDLMEMFCMEIVFDEVDKQLKENPSLTNRYVDYYGIRQRIQHYISRLDEAYQMQADAVADRYILQRENSPRLP